MSSQTMLDRQPLYQIRILGKLDESWSEWFNSLSIWRQSGPEGSVITVVTGRVPDQAALRGILNRIWDLNLELISVVPIVTVESSSQSRACPP